MLWGRYVTTETAENFRRDLVRDNLTEWVPEDKYESEYCEIMRSLGRDC